VGTCVKVVTSSSVVSLASTSISFHFRTFQTNIILFIFFDLWTYSPWKCNTIWLYKFFGIATYAYCPRVYAWWMQITFWIEPWFSSWFSWNPFYMHNENENEKERFDDVFVIVIVFVMVLSLSNILFCYTCKIKPLQYSRISLLKTLMGINVVLKCKAEWMWPIWNWNWVFDREVSFCWLREVSLHSHHWSSIQTSRKTILSHPACRPTTANC
jgi:hypothetical protein